MYSCRGTLKSIFGGSIGQAYAVRRGNLRALANHTFFQLGGYIGVSGPAAALLARRPDWRLTMRRVTCRRVEWATDSFAPYKSPGVDGILPVLLQKVRGYHSPPGQNIS